MCSIHHFKDCHSFSSDTSLETLFCVKLLPYGMPWLLLLPSNSLLGMEFSMNTRNTATCPDTRLLEMACEWRTLPEPTPLTWEACQPLTPLSYRMLQGVPDPRVGKELPLGLAEVSSLSSLKGFLED